MEGSAVSERDASGDSRVGLLLGGRYRIDQRIGEGGMAEVYRVTHALIEKTFAAKFVRPELCRNEEVVRRFLREAQIASSIKHPNVVSVTDFGETPTGEAFCIMEMLHGETLADRIVRDGALEPKEALKIVLQLCGGLSAAHRAGVVHRDLKPENVLICGGGRGVVKLIDFGVAQAGLRITAAGVALGTAEYMAPEQIRGETVDGRADLYGLGVMLYEMLTARVPFDCAELAETLESHLYRDPPCLRDADPGLQLERTNVAIGRLLSKAQGDRPGTAEEAADLIRAAIEADSGEPEPRSAPRSTCVLGSADVPQDTRPTLVSARLARVSDAPTLSTRLRDDRVTGARLSARTGIRRALVVGAAASIAAVVTLGIHHLLAEGGVSPAHSVRTGAAAPSPPVGLYDTESHTAPEPVASSGRVDGAVPPLSPAAAEPGPPNAATARKPPVVERPRPSAVVHHGRTSKAAQRTRSQPARGRKKTKRSRQPSPAPPEDLRDPFAR